MIWQKTSRVRWGLIAVVLLGGIGLAVTLGGPILRYLTMHRTWFRQDLGDGPRLGWTDRNDRHDWDGDARVWFVSTGFLAESAEKNRARDAILTTQWRPDGTVEVQLEILRQPDDTWSVAARRMTPPWLGGHGDQSVPTAPWLERGLTADAWWTLRRP